MREEQLTRLQSRSQSRPVSRRWLWKALLAAFLVASPGWLVIALRLPAAPRAPVPAGDVARGQQLIAAYQCGTCHTIPGVAAARGTQGPPLQGIARRSYIAGEVPMAPDTLRRWIIDPGSLVPGTAMPSMGVSVRDARDIVAYLATLT